MDAERARTILAWILGVAVGAPASLGGMMLPHLVQNALGATRLESGVADTGGLGLGAGALVGVMVARAILYGRPPLRGIIVGTVMLAALTGTMAAYAVFVASIDSDLLFLIVGGPIFIALMVLAVGGVALWFTVYGAARRDGDNARPPAD